MKSYGNGTEYNGKGKNRRKSTILFLAAAVVILGAVTVSGIFLEGTATETDFSRTNLAPGAGGLFGTDWMGRDMFARTLAGLSLSIRIGIVTAAVSAVIALLAGTAAATLGRKADAVISWCIDLVMGNPPTFCLSCSFPLPAAEDLRGWWRELPSATGRLLPRVIRGEVIQLRQAPYILVAEKLGASKLQNVRRHMLPHLLPQFLTGLILLFPHAILHEASVTFLGFGLSSEQPAIGVILSESMQYLTTGRWWLALFPGLALVLAVVLFALLGERLRQLMDPSSVHE